MTIKSASILARIRAVATSESSFGNPVYAPNIESVIELSTGTGADQADLVWMQELTLYSGDHVDIELVGALRDTFGSAIDMAQIVALFVINAPREGYPNRTSLTIGGGERAVTGFFGGENGTLGPIRPGSFVMLGSKAPEGYGTVTAGKSDTLRITNNAGMTNTCQICIIARSAKSEEIK